MAEKLIEKKITYQEFKQQRDLEWQAEHEKAQNKDNEAYNNGLWNAVKWNPFKWWVFLLYKRQRKNF